MNRKGSAAIIIILIVVVILVAGGIWYYETHQTTNQTLQGESAVPGPASSSQTGRSPQLIPQIPTIPTLASTTNNSVPSGRIQITNISPSTVSAGDSITISGSGFSALHLPLCNQGCSYPPDSSFGDGIWLTNGTYSANLFESRASISDNSIIVPLPSAVCLGYEQHGPSGYCYSFASTSSVPLVFASGTYSLYIKGDNGTVKSNSMPIQITPLVASTSGWATYTNSQYGFSFQYPAEWPIVTSTAGQVSFNLDVSQTGLFSIGWKQKVTTQSLLGWFELNYPGAVVTTSTPMTINGYSALEVYYDYPDTEGDASPVLLVTKDNTLVVDFYPAPLETLEALDPIPEAILNSLRF
jgi:hypothetical protein